MIGKYCYNDAHGLPEICRLPHLHVYYDHNERQERYLDIIASPILELPGMKERVEIMNGTFTIRSRPDGSTKINIEIPLEQEVSNE